MRCNRSFQRKLGFWGSFDFLSDDSTRDECGRPFLFNFRLRNAGKPGARAGTGPFFRRTKAPGDHRNFRLGVPVPFGQSLEHQVGDHFAHAAIAILRHACDVRREDEIA